MELWVLWLVIAGLLLISEIVFQWVWTLCLAIGCLAAMAAALADVSFLVQIVSLSAVSVVAYILLIPVLNRWQEKARHFQLPPATLHNHPHSKPNQTL